MSVIRFFIIGFIAAFTLTAPVHANTLTTVRTETSLITEVKSVHPGQKFWVALHIKLQPEWHTYWKNPGDSGIPLTLQWTLPNGFSAGEIEYLAPDREKIGPLVDFAYSNDAYYLVAISPPPILRDNATVILSVKARWLVCKDICIPESGELALALPVTSGPGIDRSPDASVVADLVSRLPIPAAHTFLYKTSGDEVSFDMPLKGDAYHQIKTAQFFPVTENFIANSADQAVRIAPDSLSFTVKKAEGKLADNVTGLVSMFLSNNQRMDYEVRLQSATAAPQASPEGAAVPEDSMRRVLSAVLFAFLGGVILNLMPCVFPILSLKCLEIAKKANAEPAVIRTRAVAYTAGVVISFVALAGILLLVRFSGSAVGWGYQMQSPVFVTGLLYLLFAVGLNLSGFFELPSLFGNVGGDLAAKDSALGSFFTGVLAVLVATPCTAPFMAPAIGFALTQDTGVTVGIFASLGFGLAAPFLLLSLWPRLISALPKPGAWMIAFKQFLAFPIYLTVVWLLWVLMREAGVDAGGIALIGMTLIGFTLWLWQRDSSLARFIGLLLIVVGVATTMAIVHIVPSAEPPMHGKAEVFSDAHLKALRKQGKAVFVDATADWCITCKVNESVALASQDVMQAFADKHITYMVADWTQGDMDITHYLQSFGRSGVPIYVYYPPGGEPVLLPQVLTPSIVLDAIK